MPDRGLAHLEARAPRLDEAAEVARLIDEQMADWLNWPAPTEEEVLASWGEGDPRRYARVVLSGDRLVGYGRISAVDAARTRLTLDMWARPSDGADVGRLLLAEFEPSLAMRAARKPDGIVLQSLVESRHAGMRAALAEAGYRVVRTPVRMLAEFEGPPPDTDWPEGVHVRTFTPGDERAVYELHLETLSDASDLDRDTFEDWLGATVLQPDFDPGLWFLAAFGDELIGIALSRMSSNDPSLGWFDMLGVRRSWRGRGVGILLMRLLQGEFWRRGVIRVALATDADNPTGPIRVASRAGYHVVQEWETYQRNLRTGPLRRLVARSSIRSRRLLARLRPR